MIVLKRKMPATIKCEHWAGLITQNRVLIGVKERPHHRICRIVLRLVRFPNPLATGSDIRGSWGTWLMLDTLWPSPVAGSLPTCTAARRIISTWKRLCCETSLFKIFNLCLIHYIGHSGGKHPIKPLAEKNVFLSCTSKFDLFLTKKNYSNQGRAEL